MTPLFSCSINYFSSGLCMHFHTSGKIAWLRDVIIKILHHLATYLIMSSRIYVLISIILTKPTVYELLIYHNSHFHFLFACGITKMHEHYLVVFLKWPYSTLCLHLLFQFYDYATWRIYIRICRVTFSAINENYVRNSSRTMRNIYLCTNCLILRFVGLM